MSKPIMRLSVYTKTTKKDNIIFLMIIIFRKEPMMLTNRRTRPYFSSDDAGDTTTTINSNAKDINAHTDNPRFEVVRQTQRPERHSISLLIDWSLPFSLLVVGMKGFYYY